MISFQIWSVVVASVLILLAIRTFLFTKDVRALKDVKIKEGLWPKISFIVPACNEEATMKDAAESLLHVDYPGLEFVMVNDRSIDRTGELIDDLAKEDSRVKAVHIHELPEGWLGKVHALNAGIESTESEWILLADADIHFAPDALKKAISYCEENKIDFLTTVADIRCKSFVLRTLIAQLFHQGSLFFNPSTLNNPKRRTCYGQGAFMLLRRSVYNKSEKMQWLRMEAIDDTGLALMMRRAGAKMGALAGKDEISLEWYPCVVSYIKGVEKNAFAFCQYKWSLILGMGLTNWLFVLGFTLAPSLSRSPTVIIYSSVAVAVYFLSIYFQMRKLLYLNAYLIVLFPLATLVLPLIFIRAAILATVRGGIDWRGTFYSLNDLKLNQRMKLANLVFIEKETIDQLVQAPLAALDSFQHSTSAAFDSIQNSAAGEYHSISELSS